jgi:hypothetical protein
MVQVLDLWSAPFCSKAQAASCYVAQLESAIHSALLFADCCWRDRAGDFSQMLPRLWA